MKRFVSLILILTMAAAMLAGCGAQTPQEPVSPPVPPVSDEPVTPPAPDDTETPDPPADDNPPAGQAGDNEVPPDAPQVNPPDLDAGDTGNAPDSPPPAEETEIGAAYIKFYNTWLPVSVVKDGENLLDGTDWWYFDVEKAAAEMGIPQPEENAVTDLENGEACGSICVMGWDAAVAEVEHTVYTMDNQPLYADWDDFVFLFLSSAYPEYAGSTPLVYTESWSFDLDGDSVKDHLVNLSNFQRLEDGGSTQPNPPVYGSTLLYSFSVLFYGSGKAVVMFSDAFVLENGAPISGDEALSGYDAVFYSYRLDENSSLGAECYTYAWQYAADGTVIKCPIFNIGEFDTLSRIAPAVFDADGDGAPELITWGSNVYAPLTVYDIDDFGDTVVTLRYWTPA